MGTKKLDKTGLSQVWTKIVENFVAKQEGKGLSTEDFTSELLGKLNDISEGAQVNVIEKVSVNGVELEVTEKGINIAVPEGTLADLDEVGIEQLNTELTELINEKAGKATTLNGYGITDAYTKEETTAAINNAVKVAVAGIYKVKGSIAFASLPTEGMEVGDVYNVTDDFTTTAAFVEGEGASYKAGTNVVYTEAGWDCMAGIYDFSEYLLASDLLDISEEEIDEICVMPAV